MSIPEIVEMSGVNTDKIFRLLEAEQSIFEIVGAVGKILPPQQYEMFRQHLAARLLVPNIR